MSHDGFNSSVADTRVPNTRASTQDRDAWNNPVEKPPEKKVGDNNDDANNTVVNDQMVDDIWKDIKAKEKDGDQNQNNNNNNNNNDTKPLSPTEALKKYLDDNGLGQFELSETDKTAIAGGDFSSLTNKTLQLVQQAHTKALSGASTLIKSEVARALEESRNNTKQILQGTEAVKALNAAIPATKNPAIGPVAQTVMQRFLDRNCTQEQAIEGTKQWFKLTAKEMGYTPNDVNSNRNGNFRGGQHDEGSGAQDWISVLNGQGTSR